jgi:hypothetical protein
MNGKKTKQLKKTFLTKTNEVLVLIRDEYGDVTKKIESPENVWKLFKKMYKNGKIPNEFLVKENV